MVEILDKRKCCGCGACESVCPKGCISMPLDKDGFIYPLIDKEKCINCSMCEKVCPIINKPVCNESANNMFACSSKDDESKKISSSGGMFYLFASAIISTGGVVYGTKLDEDCQGASFSKAETKEELIFLLGSKYIQSKTNKIFLDVRESLSTGRAVLFCGTPCHVAALKNYLKKDFNNLYLLDLSCHGVPSEKVYKKYLACYEKSMGGHVKSVSFRCKESGWKRFSMSVAMDNGKRHLQEFTVDPYGKAFTERLIFRPSCEHCRFKGLNRWSDITLADFWGIDEVAKEFDDDKGTSLVIIHSERGKQLFELVRNGVFSRQVSHDDGTRRNPYLLRSVIAHKNKKRFFNELDYEKFDSLVNKYATKQFVFRDFVFKLSRFIKRKINAILK